MRDKQSAPLPDYFDAKVVGDSWHLRCKVCREGWALKRSSAHVGNTLHLLNHARSHKPEPDAPDWAGEPD